MGKSKRYKVVDGKLGTDVTLNIKGLPNYVVLSDDLPDLVLGWLSRNTNLVIEIEKK